MREHRSTDVSLASIRRDLEQIDHSIVLLVAARLEAACSAIQLRSAVDGQIAYPVQEAWVIERARAWAGQLGLPPALAEAIFRAIVEAGKARYIARVKPGVSPRRRPVSSRARGDASVHRHPPVLIPMRASTTA